MYHCITKNKKFRFRNVDVALMDCNNPIENTILELESAIDEIDRQLEVKKPKDSKMFPWARAHWLNELRAVCITFGEELYRDDLSYSQKLELCNKRLKNRNPN